MTPQPSTATKIWTEFLPELLLVETDSPYLAPVPHRGRKNRPALVTVVGEAVAAARSVPVEAVAEASWATAQALYNLP